MTEEEYIEQEAQRRFESKYGKDWFKNPESQARLRDEFKQEQTRVKAEREKAVEKARADMRSGKTSTLVGKESLGVGKKGDQYAGVQGPLPLFKTQEEADISGESRYLIPAPPKSPRGGVAGREMVSPRGEGIEVRKPEAGVRRVFRAMVQGDPAGDQLFDTKQQAEDYLKQKGLKGVVAGISFKGKTEEEIKKKGEAYVERMNEQKARESELSQTYAQRTKSAQARQENLRSAMAEFDSAETPEEKEIARGKMETARREGMFEEVTRRMPQEQKQKVAAGLAGVLQRRGEREARVQRETLQARAESSAQRAGIAQERAIDNQLKFYNQQLGTLKRAYRNARIAGDDRAMFDIGQLIDVWSSGVPGEPREQRKVARSGLLQEKFTQLEKERRRREDLAKTNPDAVR